MIVEESEAGEFRKLTPDRQFPDAGQSMKEDESHKIKSYYVRWAERHEIRYKAARPLSLQPVEEELAELRDFGRDDGAAVWLRSITLEVVLMIIFGRVELRERRDLRHD